MDKAGNEAYRKPPSGRLLPDLHPIANFTLSVCFALASNTAVLSRPPTPPVDSISGHPTVVEHQSQNAALSTSDQKNPGYRWAAHSQGNIQVELNNHGEIADLFPYSNSPMLDPITGEYIYGCTYPRGSRLVYWLASSLMVGGIVGRDTLVTYGEFNPEVEDLSKFKYESMDINKRDIFSENAHSDLDIICQYFDTNTTNVWHPQCEDRSHEPLKLCVTQRSMAWSGADLGDFILLDYEVKTMGPETIDKVWIGIDFGGTIGHEFSIKSQERPSPPTVGMLREYESEDDGGYLFHPNLAYITTRDGSPINGQYDERSPLGAVGYMFLGANTDSVDVHFSWQVTWSSGEQSYWFMPQRDLGIDYPPLDVSSCY